jgi:hypothetical protein
VPAPSAAHAEWTELREARRTELREARRVPIRARETLPARGTATSDDLAVRPAALAGQERERERERCVSAADASTNGRVQARSNPRHVCPQRTHAKTAPSTKRSRSLSKRNPLIRTTGRPLREDPNPIYLFAGTHPGCPQQGAIYIHGLRMSSPLRPRPGLTPTIGFVKPISGQTEGGLGVPGPQGLGRRVRAGSRLDLLQVARWRRMGCPAFEIESGQESGGNYNPGDDDQGTPAQARG